MLDSLFSLFGRFLDFLGGLYVRDRIVDLGGERGFSGVVVQHEARLFAGAMNHAKMDIKVLAKSDKGVFLAFVKDEGYVCFSLDDSTDIELGDVMRHKTWDDQDGLFCDAYNVTRREKVGICIENWSLNRKMAYEFLWRLNRATQIWTLEDIER